MSYEINWHLTGGNIKDNPIYQTYSTKKIGDMDLSELKTVLSGMRLDDTTAPIVWFICTCIRAKTLSA
jgi:hypothetical protein